MMTVNVCLFILEHLAWAETVSNNYRCLAHPIGYILLAILPSVAIIVS
jgi:hypothetical protein